MERNDPASLSQFIPGKEKKTRDHLLVTKDIVAGRDGGGNGDCPRIVCGDEPVGCPRSWAGVVGDQTGFVDLKELECSFVDCCAVAVAACQLNEN